MHRLIFAVLVFLSSATGEECGIRPQVQMMKRIVGGTTSRSGSWPWQAALLLNGTQFCAGVLIAPEWVASASHCFHDSYSSTNHDHWTVVLGEHKLGVDEVFEQIIDIQAIYLHPLYKSMFLEGIFDTPPDFDIALIRLKRPAILDHRVSPICLLPEKKLFTWGKSCIITGWGHTRWNGTKPEALNEAEVKLVPTWVCNVANSYNGTIHERALCAGFKGGNVDACQYDSGGPLACKHDGRWYLTGLVSWGHKCALPHKYGVYTNMQVMTPWLIRQIEKHSK